MKTKANGKGAAKAAPKYTTRDARAIAVKDAQRVGEAIDDIAKRHGKATAELMVTESKSKSHPLHKFIWSKWSDDEAAYKFRLSVARDILAAVTIETHGAKHPAFIRVETVGGHVPAKTVFEDVDMTAQFIADATRDLENWYNRWSRFRQATSSTGPTGPTGPGVLEPVFKAIEKVIAKKEEKAA